MSTRDGSLGRTLATWGRRHLDGIEYGPQEPLRELRAVSLAQENLSDSVMYLTAAARAQGATWAQIGAVRGVTPQAARSRWLAWVQRRQYGDWLRHEVFGGVIPTRYVPRQGRKRRLRSTGTS